MTTEKIVEFIELLRQLPTEKQVELYYMLKGAALMAERVSA